LRDGSCPTCGAPLEVAARPDGPRAPDGRPDGGRTDGGHPPGAERAGVPDGPTGAGAEERPTAPWHFKLLMVALVLYLGYRGYQGIFWLAHHL